MPDRRRPARHRWPSPADPATDGGVGVADPPAERRRGGRGARASAGRAGGDGAGAAAGGRRARRGLRWFGGPDVRAVTVLVLLPLGLFGIPALVGHPAITGDNLIQNFPLRVLTGRQLRQGHLPLWNPYVWSGSPLLGGLNAGSFYPLTLLFALLAPVGAWVLNLLAVYWAGGLSMYALCRQFRLRPLPSVLAAVTFAFSGTMSGQFVHLGVVEGMAWTPLMVLAMLRLSWTVFGTAPAGSGGGVDARRAVPDGPARGRRRTGGSSWPWVALLGAAVGLEALTGEPRAMAETEVVGAVVVAWLLLRPYPRARRPVGVGERVRFFAYAVLGAAWGVALAAAELAPGWTFIRASQRAVESYQFFGSGSLRPTWSLLLLVPDLFGGAGHFGQQRWFNSYNLPEVTGYVGLLPLGAALVLLTRSFGRRRAAASSDWGLFLALGGLGLLLAWGSFTPLGHLWAAIPLFGKTRLQSRNLEIVDFALAVLLAFFLDRLLSDRAAARSRAASDLEGWRRYVAVAPALGAVVVCVVTMAAPSPLERWLHASARGAPLASRLWPWFLAEIGVAAAVVALVWAWRRLGAPTRRLALAAVLLADVGLFVTATSTAVAPPNATTEPVRAVAAAVVGSSGRFAIVDTSVSRLLTLTAVGQPDLNAFTRLPSVQGYGSIVSGTYGDATGTHFLDTLSGCALARGRFTPLRLSTLVVFPGNLVTLVRSTPADGGPTTAPSPVPHVPTAVPATPASCPGAPVAGTGGSRVLYLGWPVRLVAATVVVRGAPAPPGSRAPRAPVVSVLGAHGAARRPAETVRATAAGWHVTFARAQRATGIVVRDARTVSLATTVTSASGTSWAFEGTLQSALDLPAWRLRGTLDGTFGVFGAARPVDPPVRLARAAPGSTVRQVRATDWGTTVDRVDAAGPVTVVWSQTYFPGWHAELQPLSFGRPHGAPRPATVRRDGLVQSVRVPRGTWLLTFTYRPRTLDLGLAGSLVALAAFALFGAVALVRRRGATRRTGRGAGVPVA